MRCELTPLRSMTTAGSSFVPFLLMVLPLLLVTWSEMRQPRRLARSSGFLTSALPSLTSATLPAVARKMSRAPKLRTSPLTRLTGAPVPADFVALLELVCHCLKVLFDKKGKATLMPGRNSELRSVYDVALCRLL